MSRIYVSTCNCIRMVACIAWDHFGGMPGLDPLSCVSQLATQLFTQAMEDPGFAQ